ncbi:MAG TPA: TA system VapC family ribonuclease toxin [Burkholderiaceae bacterium]
MTRAGAVWLLDANLLIALTHSAHVHHTEAHTWFAAQPRRRWATCALTQLAFVRLTSNPKVVGSEITPAEAMQALAAMAAQPTHEYWEDGPAPLQLATLRSASLVGHRQVTDAYLLGLAALRGQRLATLDRGLASFASATGFDANVEFVSASPTASEPAARYTVKRLKSRPSTPARRPGSPAG